MTQTTDSGTTPRARSIAFVFPGQGSQYVGMGKQLYDASPAARRIFEQANTTLGFSLSTLCFEGPQEELESCLAGVEPSALRYRVPPHAASVTSIEVSVESARSA